MKLKLSAENKFKVNFCLDEIEASQKALSQTKNKEEIKVYESWIRQNKLELKNIGYKGSIPRKARRSK